LLHLLDHCLYPVLTPPPDPLPLPTRSPKTRSGLAGKKHRTNVICFTACPIDPLYTPAMTPKASQPSLQPSDDLRVDYALIASSLAAGLFALIYLILF
jgi:hypothetical protein